MASYAVVHSTVSGMLRRVIVDDDGRISVGTLPDGVTPAVICEHEDCEPSYHPLIKGETATVQNVPRGRATTPADWHEAIRQRTGKQAPELTCALVDWNNVVTGVICADIDVDPPPDERLMVHCYSPMIGVGCSYNPETGLFSTAGGVMRPQTPGNPTDDDIEVPPAVIPRP